MLRGKFGPTLLNILFGFAMTFAWAPPANAAITYSYVSAYDTYTPTSLSSIYDVQYIQVVRDSSDPVSITFVAYFAQPVPSDIYKYQNGKTPFGAMLLYRTDPGAIYGGEKRDTAIYTSSSSFTGNQELSIDVFGNTQIGGTRNSIYGCNSKSWTDINSNARWIAFKVNKSCAYIPDQFWLQYYSDENSSSGSNRTAYDWVANSAIYIDLTRATLSNPPYASPFTVNGVQPTPTPSPSIQKQRQTIPGFENKLYSLSLGTLDLPRYSDQGLEIFWESANEDVCRVNRYTYEVILEGVGSCSLIATAEGDDYYETQISNFYLPIWDDSAYTATKKPSATKKPTIKPTPKPSPKKTISGSATAKKKSSPTAKATINGKIGGSASGKG